jgi:hypothetical protein
MLCKMEINIQTKRLVDCEDGGCALPGEFPSFRPMNWWDSTIWSGKDHTFVLVNASLWDSMDAYKFGLSFYAFNWVLEGEVLTIVHCETTWFDITTHICWLNIVSSLQTLFSSPDWFTTHLPVQHKTRWTRPAANAIMDAKDADQTFIMGLLLFWEWFCSKFVWLHPLPCPSWQQQDTLQLRRERSL